MLTSGYAPNPISLRFFVIGDTNRKFHWPRPFLEVGFSHRPFTVPSGKSFSPGLIALALASVSTVIVDPTCYPTLF